MSEVLFYTRDGEYGFLSNFWRAKQRLPTPARFGQDIDHEYPTNEHWYQANKAATWDVFIWVAAAPHPYLAMKAGRYLREGKELVPGWDAMRVEVMLTGLRVKFSQNQDLKARLLATGDAAIHEDSKDMFWGRKGEDMLGRLLVQVRGELRD